MKQLRRVREILGWRTGLPVAALVAAVLAVGVAVASSTVPGHPVPGMTPPDWSKLQVGPYPSAPIDYDPLYDGAADAYRMESRRMLTYLVSPDEIDPDVRYLDGARTLDTSDANFADPGDIFAADAPFPKAWQSIAQQNQLISGAYVSRNNDSIRHRKYIALAILRFPTEQKAQAAVDGFFGALSGPRIHPIPLDGIDARASSTTEVKGQVFAVHGVYAIVGHAMVQQADALAERLRAMARAQLDKMADLKPTPLEDIPDLPTNPDNIMGITLPNRFGTGDSDPSGGLGQSGEIYSAAGALHFERDGVAARRAFAAAGVDLVARNAATVYRTRDLAAAFALQTALTTLGRDDDEFPNPPGITDSQCVQLDEPEPIRNYTYLCAVVYGRYVAVIGAVADFGGAVPASFVQRVAAQYSMLVKSG
ncbi:hypothetical protein GPX89_04540 [Nocardia sp. ET3-3]|uniref:Uncharacterized protein n=1 Tax=Nocardia terrae TaxID=2675851 RepID=A0A7K1UQS8_9NOCA|nr:hypothetical protein [Nocardia terrae]MVU76509.1 hypothetical protein [Nocardia terrae]